MLVGVPIAHAFGLRGGIPMKAAQTNVYHAPASRACRHYAIDLNTYVHTNHSLAKKCGAPRLHSNVRECTRRTKVRKQGAIM